MYKFSLESLLDHRKHLEENLDKELGRIKRALNIEVRRLERLTKNKKKCQQNLQKNQGDGRKINEIILCFNYLHKLSIDIDKQKKCLKNVEKEYEIKRSELIEAMKKRKTLDRLKEKEKKAFNYSEMKVEQEMMNEVAANQFNRKTS
ncbi:MAG: flagellar export protein FliJ [Deltaproteobacteria bacterium]|nr:flagellar export protein FliJ [Deltaproteobacteria bacterium]MBT8373558.1 flagellar export protein FliJ [Deltaproteobacteria bacterium]NNK84492.1 flagellar export protein FliJ [Desulfobacterales bacterium]